MRPCDGCGKEAPADGFLFTEEGERCERCAAPVWEAQMTPTVWAEPEPEMPAPQAEAAPPTASASWAVPLRRCEGCGKNAPIIGFLFTEDGERCGACAREPNF